MCCDSFELRALSQQDAEKPLFGVTFCFLETI